MERTAVNTVGDYSNSEPESGGVRGFKRRLSSPQIRASPEELDDQGRVGMPEYNKSGSPIILAFAVALVVAMILGLFLT